MEILYLLIPMSVVLVFVIAVIFWWTIKSGQFEDLEGPGYRILMDDDLPKAKEEIVTRDELDPSQGATKTMLPK